FRRVLFRLFIRRFKQQLNQINHSVITIFEQLKKIGIFKNKIASSVLKQFQIQKIQDNFINKKCYKKGNCRPQYSKKSFFILFVPNIFDEKKTNNNTIRHSCCLVQSQRKEDAEN